MYKYYKSDLTLLLHTAIKRQTSTGELLPVHTDTPFNIRFYVHKKGTAETGYLASYDGTTVHNCTILSPTDIMVYIDQSQLPLPTGDLYVEIEFLYPDAHFEGDDENNLKRLYTTGITLTADPDLHDEGAVTIEVFNEVIAKEIIALAEQKATEVATATATTVANAKATEVANAKATEVANAKATEVADAKAEQVAKATATSVANTKATEVATATATEVATAKAQQVAEQAVASYVFATDSDIDALWQ